MKSLLLPLFALAAIVFAAISVARSQPSVEKYEPPTSPPRAEFPRSIAAVGLVEASSENIVLGAPLPGIVEKVFVKAGDPVKAGQELFTQETRHLTASLGVRQAALWTAQALLKTAETELTDAQDQLDRSQQLGKERVISTDEWARKKFAVQKAEARIEEARAAVASAEAQMLETQTEIERRTVRAPIDGQMLQVKVRPGEFAPAGQTVEPLLVLGGVRPLHVRVDVDEHEGWRVQPEAPATAFVRGNADLKADLKFVRVEPMVVPKKSLSGASTERVDTRVLQVIYAVADDQLPLYVGQQMDVFIQDVGPPAKTVAR